MFLKKTGCNDDRSYDTMCQVFFIYFELAITLFFAVSSCLSIVNSTEGLSVRLYGLLCFLIESHIFFFIAVRLYYLPQFRDMYQRTLKMGIPENFRQRIAMVIKHHFIISNVFVSVSMLYTISMDWVQMGDPFTFPFIDVLPIKTTNLTIYVCKYILYTLPVYIAHFETCFLNVTFMYSTGVMKRYFQILDGQVEEAMVNKDEQQLKIAIKHHQEVLKWVVFNARIFVFKVHLMTNNLKFLSEKEKYLKRIIFFCLFKFSHLIIIWYHYIRRLSHRHILLYILVFNNDLWIYNNTYNNL